MIITEAADLSEQERQMALDISDTLVFDLLLDGTLAARQTLGRAPRRRRRRRRTHAGFTRCRPRSQVGL